LLFFYTTTGKPILAPWFGKAIHFNVSHSGQLALYAVSLNHDVGVDVERVSPIPEAASIAARFFTAEQAARIGDGDDGGMEFFYRLWTRKEALLKCTGEGLTDDPASLAELPESLVSQLEPAHGFVGAIAVKSLTPMRLQTWRWEDSSIPATSPAYGRQAN
jgi:4'-phosphopantetheinyl transferase